MVDPDLLPEHCPRRRQLRQLTAPSGLGDGVEPGPGPVLRDGQDDDDPSLGLVVVGHIAAGA